ncbi:hypothetical protein BX600DRAFT_127796 [Xylariales sp. PMI_506]|nr:hypothetical protein BX600DRAFT_127796 [Xylariales sp. PMI_506]
MNPEPSVVWIDLTDDRDDSDDEDKNVLATSTGSAPRSKLFKPTITSSRHRLLLKSPPLSASASPCAHDEDEDGFEAPTAKRRRTKSPTLPFTQSPTASELPDFHEFLLARYLEETLWPSISAAIDELIPNYEGNKTNLHFTVTDDILRDARFQREWNQNEGSLSPAFEASLKSTIRSLILQLKDNPERLRSPRPAESTTFAAAAAAAPSVADANADHLSYEDDTRGIPSREQQLKSLPVADDFILYPRARPARKKTQDSTQTRVEARAKAAKWQSGKAVEETTPSGTRKRGNGWFGLQQRPYLHAGSRQKILDGNLRVQPGELPRSRVVHVDFGRIEIDYLQYVARALWGSSRGASRKPIDDLRHLLKKARRHNRQSALIVAHQSRYEGFDEAPAVLLTRTAEDLASFLSDLYQRKMRPVAQTLTLSPIDLDSQPPRVDRTSTLLFTREIVGNRAFGSIRRYEDFSTAFKTGLEDGLEPQIEWTNCAGDIATISWISASHFICGTTTHSDSHNQQYNKPGNLLLGSNKGLLQAYPDHRIPRPVVSQGDNSLESMVETQDPWLYSSVVSSDYDANHNLAFTSSFDNTVKIWNVKEGAMEVVGTWHHSGRVNFVVASKHTAGLVATAADLTTRAVRVYHLGQNGEITNNFDSYSCTKVHDEDYVPSEKWAYCPAAIRWGLAPMVQHLLLVGYSPRSLRADDRDIPEDRANTGELCLWDAIHKIQVKVNSLATQNVFEVAWHPSIACFAAATSKAVSIERTDQEIKTQIRLFKPNVEGQYTVVKTFDCEALDINELSIQPNSGAFCYVAAGCTNGKVYVWDSAGSDRPMCVLAHDEPVEELLGEREQEDVGVKFVAWGTTADRLYTGSSDGVVKVWNIRHGKAIHLRDLIETPGPITFGTFSPDYTSLALGDGSGRVYLLRLEEDSDAEEGRQQKMNHPGLLRLQLGGRQRAVRRPRPFTPHAEQPPPNNENPEPRLHLGQSRARGYVERQELVLHPNPLIGAVKGPFYYNTGLFRADAHRDDDVLQPLLSAVERHQQENNRYHFRRQVKELKQVQATPAHDDLHKKNCAVDLNIAIIDQQTQLELAAEGVLLDAESDYDFAYETDEYHEQDEHET